MGTDFSSGQYYDRISKNNKLKYIDTQLSTQIVLEQWLRKYFNNELSRILYASQDRAFIARIDSLDKGKNADGVLKHEMLDLPYAIYHQTGDAEADDRNASVNAAQAISGRYFPDVDRTMRALAVKTKYKLVAFFDKVVEAREFATLMLWEQKPEYSIRLYTEIIWRNTPINLPVFITIDSINSQPDYEESKFLTDNRIFPVEVELTVRSYQMSINNVNKICQLPIRFSNFKDTFEEDETEDEYVSENVILTWAGEKFDIKLDADGAVDLSDREYQNLSQKYFAQQVLTEQELVSGVVNIPNRYTIDLIKDYFNDYHFCNLESYSQNVEESTSTSVKVDFNIKDDQLLNFSKIVMSIPTKGEVEIKDLRQKSITFEGLNPNSEYKSTIQVYDTDNVSKYYFLTVKTKDDPKNKAPKPEKINFAAGLVGMKGKC